MFCKYCGNEVSGHVKFCPNCGADIRESANTTNNTSSTNDREYYNNSERQSNTNNTFEGNDSLAIIAYITWIGFFIALIMNRDNENSFVSFHLNQALVLHIAALLASIPLIGWLWGIAVFVFWIMAIISAIQKKTDPLPIIGNIHIIG